ncbi:hypothetical protein [Gordonia sp. ABSL49_1]|nr:hypothetical protein [Gordonia sp. ABSL49_1]MCH5643231.1 hypothetical protein [Gordonia sp. ABSL49_1]
MGTNVPGPSGRGGTGGGCAAPFAARGSYLAVLAAGLRAGLARPDLE